MKKMKQVVFIEIRHNRETVTLPYKFTGIPGSVSIINWTLDPVTYVNDLNGQVKSPYYFQLRFTGGGMETNFIPYGANQNMVQIPLIRLSGWPSTIPRIPLPLALGKRLDGRFQIEVFDEGCDPRPFPFGPDTRLILWLELEVESDTYSQFNSYSYVQ
jgi:hypothetical protein